MQKQPHKYPKIWRCPILSHPICLQAPSQALSTTNKHVVVVKICAPRKFDFFAISSYEILNEVKHILVKLFILHNKKNPLFHSHNFCILSGHIGANKKDNQTYKDGTWDGDSSHKCDYLFWIQMLNFVPCL